VGWFLRARRHGWAFIMNGLTIALTVISAFMGLYPRVMVSSLNPEWSLTIYNASSSPYTLTVMTIVALIFVPIVLVYQGWTYYVFRQRLGRESKLTY
jgi:cytochrome d ubiquinol oxidase subunit II